MRRRPFKFFFGVSVAIIVFFFLAKVFVSAFIIAAIMSLFFYAGRGVKSFFTQMDWQDRRSRKYQFAQDRYAYNEPYVDRHSFSDDWGQQMHSTQRERIIKVM